MIRSILSIIAGYLVFIIAVWVVWALFGYGQQDIPSTEFHIFSLFCECIIAIGTGYLIATIAKQRVLYTPSF